jgi:ketosteroid isomerase-like protein
MSRRIRMLLASAAVALITGPGIAAAGAGTGGDTDDDAQLVADAKRAERAYDAAWNDKRWDDLRLLYAEDALLVLPNQDPIEGRERIVDQLKRSRDAIGEIDDHSTWLRATGSGDLAVLAGQITTRSGRVRLTYSDVWERQADGTVVITVSAVGLPQRPVG